MSEENRARQFAPAPGWALEAARRRFNDLAILEAVGRATSNEMAKLERYDALISHKPTQEEVRHQARQDWQWRIARKMVGRLLRAAQRPNAQAHRQNPRNPRSRNYDLP